MGHPADLMWKHERENSMLGKQGSSRGMADGAPCKTRALWQRLHCLNANPDGVLSPPTGNMPGTSVACCFRSKFRRKHLSARERARNERDQKG